MIQVNPIKAYPRARRIEESSKNVPGALEYFAPSGAL